MTILPDVNVLLAAHRNDNPNHAEAAAVLDRIAGHGFALCSHTWNGFIRLSTLATVCQPPSPLKTVLEVVREWRSRPDSRVLVDTSASWEIFDRICLERSAVGNAVYDVHLAALAIAHRCLVVSYDRDFTTIPGVKWKPPSALV
ncbi:ribonuclease VapC [Planctomycetota bacterium]|nr:ribonuclease VapC [Planctomycetota bacterium]